MDFKFTEFLVMLLFGIIVIGAGLFVASYIEEQVQTYDLPNERN